MDKQYTEEDLERLFEQAARKGAILASLHFDAYSREKEAVSAALVDLVSRLSSEKGVIYCKGEVEETLEREDEKGKMYSTFCEARVLFDSLDTALRMAMKYGPVSVEVLKPREIRVNAEQLQNILLNASSTSQQYTNYFMERLLTPADFADFQAKLKARVEAGKKKIEEAAKK